LASYTGAPIAAADGPVDEMSSALDAGIQRALALAWPEKARFMKYPASGSQSSRLAEAGAIARDPVIHRMGVSPPPRFGAA